ncbi:class I SAM-dependent methyltransferase [Prosthecobacter vanneervenii]|uniref:2-polyprenyl-3-methyl-5-hydroxy-6-metoxy-1, 4-benzoquinol methylase n=1 Tax=Prosthecobacter vanneervenii TaxID=48466 RepID=A0A7W8DIS0_9BACT|nr:class I SAM-dependent methyltransferase [Prosthecobacter vanneervenii]MBB5031101.1 2-polyprenyl-3-methyl-5-hydroxy-6-metoxy-1,4-benzoquinol methylase [Prosthecobacter vanneervenii]
MQPADIARSYDEIAHQWLEPHLETNGMRQHEHALRFRKQQGGGRALDVGCGCHGRFIRLLSQHGYAVEGLDISARMIELARQRHPGVTFHHVDVCQWEPEGAYDFITAWDSIWHLPLVQSAEVITRLCGALAPGGILIFTLGGLDEPGEKQDSSMGPPMHYSTPGIPQTLQVLASAGCILRHLEYDQHPEMHVFVIAQKS